MCIIADARRDNNPKHGVIYIIHFNQAYHHARHYLGWSTPAGIWIRLEQHRKGKGARLLQVLKEQGITWECVDVIPGSKSFERRLKRNGGGARYCPICHPEKYGWLAETKERV